MNDNDDETKDWYTISELADRNCMSRKTIWAWARSGKLKSQRIGAQYRINVCDWLQFLSDCNIQE